MMRQRGRCCPRTQTHLPRACGTEYMPRAARSTRTGRSSQNTGHPHHPTKTVTKTPRTVTLHPSDVGCVGLSMQPCWVLQNRSCACPHQPRLPLQVDKLKLSKEGKGAAASRKQKDEVPDAGLLTQYQLSLAQFRQRKRVKGDREKDLLGKLKTFQGKLKEPAGAAAAAAGSSKAVDVGSNGKEVDHRAYLPPAWRVRAAPLLSVQCTACTRNGHHTSLRVACCRWMGIWRQTLTRRGCRACAATGCSGSQRITLRTQLSGETTLTTTRSSTPS